MAARATARLSLVEFNKQTKKEIKDERNLKPIIFGSGIVSAVTGRVEQHEIVTYMEKRKQSPFWDLLKKPWKIHR